MSNIGPFMSEDFRKATELITNNLAAANLQRFDGINSQLDAIYERIQPQLEEANRIRFAALEEQLKPLNSAIESRFSEIAKSISKLNLSHFKGDRHAIDETVDYLNSVTVSEVLDSYLELALKCYSEGNILGALLAIYPYTEGVATLLWNEHCHTGQDDYAYSNMLFTKLAENFEKKGNDEVVANIAYVREPWISRQKGTPPPDSRNDVCHGQLQHMPSLSSLSRAFDGALVMLKIYESVRVNQN